MDFSLIIYNKFLYGTTIKRDGSTISEKVCKTLLHPSPQAWGIPSLRGICDGRYALSSATAHKHKTNSLSPSCFFNTGAGQSLERSAGPVHFDEADLASSPLLVARHDAYRLLRHTLVGFLPERKTEKKHYYFATKKTKRLSLQQNGCRPSRSRATQRFLMRPRAFFGAVSSYGWRRAGHEHRKKRCTFPETRCTNSMRKHKKIRSTHLLTHK